MMIILAVLGIGLSIFAVGLSLYSLTSSELDFQSLVSSTFIPKSDLNFVLGLGIVLMVIGVLVCILGVARNCIKYDIHNKQPALGKIKIVIGLSLWKKILLLNIPPNYGEIKFQISYRNTDDSLPINCHLVDERGSQLYISEPLEQELQVWYEENNQRLRLDDKRILPCKLEFEIRLIKSNNQIIKRIPLEYG